MRPLDLVRDVGRRFPTVWKEIEGFRESRGKKGLPDWPSWCFCPLAGAYAVATRGSDDRLPSGNAVAEIGAIAAWRASQGIYKIHPDLIDPLSDTPLGEIPAEWLFQLPEWCIWVDVEPAGFFAHLESDAKTGRPELRFWVVPPEGASYPLVIHLDQPTLAEGVEQAVTEAKRNSVESLAGEFKLPGEVIDHMKRVAGMFTALVVYVIGAVQHRDIRDTKGVRQWPSRASITPNHPTIWEVGWKQGELFRRAFRSESQGGEHSSPRPHVRRAHWHHFWEGPKGGDRRLIVHWIPPTIVGAGNLIPTVHEVDGVTIF